MNITEHTRKTLPKEAKDVILNQHYLRRLPSISTAFVGTVMGKVVAVVTFGVPASRGVQVGACPTDPNCVLELNRLWVDDECPRNTESWFISKALKRLPKAIVVSYADTSVGHSGYVYRAANFFYAGWTDMDRKTPRFDYVSPGKHSRDAFRAGYTHKIRRKPKHKYWTVSGDKRDRREMLSKARWPSLDWRAVKLSEVTTDKPEPMDVFS